jgi:23S rRNA (uracil-5-)-methyltransferase RumA
VEREPLRPVADTLLSLLVEKPAAGGRMIARHNGQVVLVAGAIPGERVRARVERTKGGVIYASTVEVETPSADRRTASGDPSCGGNVYAHVAYARQTVLKGEIVADALRRIGHITLEAPVHVHASPEMGYRMRARLHVRGGRIGFFREGTHELCDAGASGQLLPDTMEFLNALGASLQDARVSVVRELELAENVSADQRAVLLELEPGSAAPHAVLRSLSLPHAHGVLVSQPTAPDRLASRGNPHVTDVLSLSADGVDAALTLRRHVASFFQGNRYLLASLVQRVVTQVPHGPVIDLYAGVGLFGLACAAVRRGEVVAVEGDRYSAQDLQHNAHPFQGTVRVVTASVEAFLAREQISTDATVIVDPPRTGMSSQASQGIAAARPGRIIYVSCDVATLARDVGRLVAGGYQLDSIEAFDLFPNTAHVETLAELAGGARPART